MQRIAILVTGLIFSGGLVSDAWGQSRGVRQVAEDYRAPTVYSPADPWIRSAVYRNHVGHFGLYYNCDGEEEKRSSPYICWKSQCNRVPQLGPCQTLLSDIAEVKQRWRWGACQSECRQSTADMESVEIAPIQYGVPRREMGIDPIAVERLD